MKSLKTTRYISGSSKRDSMFFLKTWLLKMYKKWEQCKNIT